MVVGESAVELFDPLPVLAWIDLNRLIRRRVHSTMVARLHLSHCVIADSPWRWLLGVLPALPALLELDLSETAIDDLRARALLGALCGGSASTLPPPPPPRGGGRLVRIKRREDESHHDHRETLVSLGLSSNSMTARSAHLVGQWLTKAKVLQVLDLSGNMLADHGVQIISAHLKLAPPHLRNLSLADNGCSIRGIVDALVGASEAPGLRDIDLSRNVPSRQRRGVPLPRDAAQLPHEEPLNVTPRPTAIRQQQTSSPVLPSAIRQHDASAVSSPLSVGMHSDATTQFEVHVEPRHWNAAAHNTKVAAHSGILLDDESVPMPALSMPLPRDHKKKNDENSASSPRGGATPLVPRRVLENFRRGNALRVINLGSCGMSAEQAASLVPFIIKGCDRLATLWLHDNPAAHDALVWGFAVAVIALLDEWRAASRSRSNQVLRRLSYIDFSACDVTDNGLLQLADVLGAIVEETKGYALPRLGEIILAGSRITVDGVVAFLTTLYDYGFHRCRSCALLLDVSRSAHVSACSVDDISLLQNAVDLLEGSVQVRLGPTAQQESTTSLLLLQHVTSRETAQDGFGPAPRPVASAPSHLQRPQTAADTSNRCESRTDYPSPARGVPPVGSSSYPSTAVVGLSAPPQPVSFYTTPQPLSSARDDTGPSVSSPFSTNTHVTEAMQLALEALQRSDAATPTRSQSKVSVAGTDGANRSLSSVTAAADKPSRDRREESGDEAPRGTDNDNAPTARACMVNADDPSGAGRGEEGNADDQHTGAAAASAAESPGGDETSFVSVRTESAAAPVEGSEPSDTAGASPPRGSCPSTQQSPEEPQLDHSCSDTGPRVASTSPLRSLSEAPPPYDAILTTAPPTPTAFPVLGDEVAAAVVEDQPLFPDIDSMLNRAREALPRVAQMHSFVFRHPAGHPVCRICHLPRDVVVPLLSSDLQELLAAIMSSPKFFALYAPRDNKPLAIHIHRVAVYGDGSASVMARSNARREALNCAMQAAVAVGLAKEEDAAWEAESLPGQSLADRFPRCARLGDWIRRGGVVSLDAAGNTLADLPPKACEVADIMGPFVLREEREGGLSADEALEAFHRRHTDSVILAADLDAAGWRQQSVAYANPSRETNVGSVSRDADNSEVAASQQNPRDLPTVDRVQVPEESAAPRDQKETSSMARDPSPLGLAAGASDLLPPTQQAVSSPSPPPAAANAEVTAGGISPDRTGVRPEEASLQEEAASRTESIGSPSPGLLFISTQGAVLRLPTEQEFAEYHVPSAASIPLVHFTLCATNQRHPVGVSALRPWIAPHATEHRCEDDDAASDPSTNQAPSSPPQEQPPPPLVADPRESASRRSEAADSSQNKTTTIAPSGTSNADALQPSAALVSPNTKRAVDPDERGLAAHRRSGGLDVFRTFRDMLVERSKRHHAKRSSRPSSGPSPPQRDAVTPSSTSEPPPPELRRALQRWQRTTHAHHTSEQTQADTAARRTRAAKLFDVAYACEAMGEVSLPPADRDKQRICKGRCDGHRVTVSVEWHDFLVVKRDDGLGLKTLLHVHPLVGNVASHPLCSPVAEVSQPQGAHDRVIVLVLDRPPKKAGLQQQGAAASQSQTHSVVELSEDPPVIGLRIKLDPKWKAVPVCEALAAAARQSAARSTTYVLRVRGDAS